jgi:hypothetical protein
MPTLSGSQRRVYTHTATIYYWTTSRQTLATGVKCYAWTDTRGQSVRGADNELMAQFGPDRIAVHSDYEIDTEYVFYLTDAGRRTGHYYAVRFIDMNDGAPAYEQMCVVERQLGRNLTKWQ